MRGARPTIGLFVDWLGDDYQNTVVAGVADAVREADANLLCFAGGALRSTQRSGIQRNAIYDLVSSACVDGLVIMAGTLANTVGAAEVSRFCERWRLLPLASVAVQLEGIPSVLVDNATGMREAMAHLIGHHARRRIAFVRGPAANAEASHRYRVYREMLEESGIGFDPALVTQGDFELASGSSAVAELVDDRGIAFDALVAASDRMAMGAMAALHARGIRVPNDVAVIGFDDVDEARFAIPSLSTVRQPLYEQGRRAAQIVISTLRGEAMPDGIMLHTQLVARRSCGCSAAPGGSSFDRADELSAALASDLTIAAVPGSAQRDTALSALEAALRARLASGGELASFRAVVWEARRRAIADRADLRDRIEALCHEAHVLVGEHAELAQAEHRLVAERRMRRLSETGEALITSFDTTGLLSALKEWLPRLGIASAFLSVYRNADAPAERSRLILAFDERRAEALPSGMSFPSRALVPAGMLPADRRFAYVVEPLFFKDRALGFALLEMGPREGIVYESLRDQISAAMEGARLVQEVVDHDRHRQRLLRYVLDVTPDMHRVQPLADLFHTIFEHAAAMVEACAPTASAAGLSMVPPPAAEGLVAIVEDARLVVRAGSPRFVTASSLEEALSLAHARLAREVMLDGEVRVVDVGHPAVDVCTILPLCAGEIRLGVIWLESTAGSQPDVALLSAFGNQASAAIRSMQLYEMAALDPLTGAHARRFFEDWLERLVRAAYRSQTPVTLLMLDMDAMKRINDTAGHLAGDQALSMVGRVLRQATRPNDLVGRYGGDEFVVVLPQTDAVGAERLATRILDLLDGKSVRGPEGDLFLRISIGLSTLEPARELAPQAVPSEYFHRMAQALIQRADEALYCAKRRGGMRAISGEPTPWAPL